MKNQTDLLLELEDLPKGYISKKNINGKTYFYLQYKDGKKLDLSEDAAFDVVDEAIKEHGKIELQIQVIDALIEAGFLPRAIDTKQLRATLSEAIAEASKITGEATK